MDLGDGTWLTVEIFTAGGHCPVEVGWTDSDGSKRSWRRATNGSSEVRLLDGETGRKVAYIIFDNNLGETTAVEFKKWTDGAPPTYETLYDGPVGDEYSLFKPPDDGDWQLLTPQWIFGTKRILLRNIVPHPEKGDPGDPGRSILNGTGPPDPGDGIDGDFYIDTSAWDIYGPKAGGVWGAGTPIIGPAGADGRTVLNGSGAPGGGVGVVGDFYIDTAAWDIYGPKAGGGWGAGTSLIGPEGDPGVDGNTILSGDGPPGPGAGVDGDYYMDKLAWEIYGPKAGGTWPAGVPIIGTIDPLAEMEMEYQAAFPYSPKDLDYDVDGNLIDVDIWEDGTRMTRLYHKDLTYDVNGNLTKTVLTRIADAFTMTKDFTYDGDDNLVSIDRS